MFNSKEFWIGVVIASVAWIAFGYWNSSRTTA
jgi:predicted negative regulator of RcsB-dependent stress response